MIGQLLGVITTPGITTVTIGIGTDSVDLILAPIIPDIGVTVAVILTEVTLDPFTSPHTIAHHATEAQAYTATAETHHTADPHHAGTAPEMKVDPEHAIQQTPLHPGNPKIGSTNRLQLMIHPQNIIALMNKTVILRLI